MKKVIVSLIIIIKVLNAFQYKPIPNEKSCRCKMSSSNFVPKTTNLPKYLDEHEVDEELKTVICQAVVACIEISNELKNLPIVSFLQKDVIQSEGGEMNIQGEVQKPMDVIANNIFIEKVQPHVGALASEENEEIIPGTSVTGKYEIAFDPLDGSSNLDVSIPTVSDFCISFQQVYFASFVSHLCLLLLFKKGDYLWNKLPE